MDLQSAGRRAMSLYVGVDAGASHTEAVASVAPDAVVSRWRGAPGTVRPGEESRAVGCWRDAIEHVLATAPTRTVDAVAVGAAGTGREATRREVERRLAEVLDGQPRVRVTTDGVIAMEAAFPGGRPGIVVMAGSGSIAYAREEHGERLQRAGGLGWRMGDEGSGYWLAREALAAVGRARDGRADPTGLGDRLMSAAGCASLDELVRWSVAASPAEVAALAAPILEAATAREPLALRLVDGAARELTALVGALRPRGRSLEVALGGGLLSAQSPVRHTLVRILGDSEPTLTVQDEPVDPPLGALRLACRL
jgi:glucosamine kinase